MPEEVDTALNFLRDRRPLGDTVEADELLLQAACERVLTVSMTIHDLNTESVGPGTRKELEFCRAFSIPGEHP